MLKSYSQQEFKSFSINTMIEALRIKRLILSVPCSTKESVQYLLSHNMICMEELLGIEHIVFGKTPNKLACERAEHSRAIIDAQKRLLDDSLKPNEQRAQELAELACSRTRRSVKRARVRAAMAAWTSQWVEPISSSILDLVKHAVMLTEAATSNISRYLLSKWWHLSWLM